MVEKILLILGHFENKYAKFWINEGILYFIYKPRNFINLKAAEKIVKDRLNLQNEKAYPVLCDLRSVKKTEKPARDYLADKGSILATAVALIIEKPYSSILGESFLELSKPDIPTRMFTTKVSALEFLQTFMK